MEQTPVSYQTRKKMRRGDWRQDVKNAARQVWGSESPVTGPVMVTITYFFDDILVDVDNIPKPILDALEGVVFEDDSQVYDLLCPQETRTGRFDDLNVGHRSCWMFLLIPRQQSISK